MYVCMCVCVPVTPTPRTVSTNQQLLANAWDSTPQTFDNGYYANMITAVCQS